MALSMMTQRWCQQISSWRRAAATIRYSAPGIPAVTPVLGGKSGKTTVRDPRRNIAHPDPQVPDRSFQVITPWAA
jgi:hypothetical protein